MASMKQNEILDQILNHDKWLVHQHEKDKDKIILDIIVLFSNYTSKTKKLLERALSALKEVEYDIDLRIIADIEEELNKGLDENNIRK